MLKLLVEVAESNPGVMRYPRPTAFFLGFGDSSLDFELRFWSTQDARFGLKSEVTVKALGEAGIEIPFPQRDLHVRSIDVSVKEALVRNHSANTSATHTAGLSAARSAPQEQGSTRREEN